jgi:hypothetical protein
MDKKTTGLIATIATAILCGCPGLFGLCMGAMFAIVGAIPGSNIDVMGSSDPSAAIGTGLAMLCVGLIFVAIPVVVGFVTLRKPKDDTGVVGVKPVEEPTPAVTPPATTPEPPKPPTPPADDEPLPPAS